MRVGNLDSTTISAIPRPSAVFINSLQIPQTIFERHVVAMREQKIFSGGACH
jgi:hypothetical protein